MPEFYTIETKDILKREKNRSNLKYKITYEKNRIILNARSYSYMSLNYEQIFEITFLNGNYDEKTLDLVIRKSLSLFSKIFKYYETRQSLLFIAVILQVMRKMKLIRYIDIARYKTIKINVTVHDKKGRGMRDNTTYQYDHRIFINLIKKVQQIMNENGIEIQENEE